MFDNDDPVQRKSLIQALQSSGLQASEYSSGGGIMHVIVPLLDDCADPPTLNAQDRALRMKLEAARGAWPHEAALYIATGSAYKPCEVGLFGYNGQTGNQVETPEWTEATSLEHAVALFRRYWEERDKWLTALLAGELDVA